MIEVLNKIVDYVENTLVVVLIFTATIVAIIQVVARYVFNNSLYWSEELILYSLISMSFFTASMGVRLSAHISVEALYAFVGPRAIRALKMIAAILGLVFAGTLIYYGSRLYVSTGEMGQLSPAMQLPVAYIYLTIPIAGAFMVIRYLSVISKLVQGTYSEKLDANVNVT
jgi:C4-dicarboxylate transporter DctQ subunit